MASRISCSLHQNPDAQKNFMIKLRTLLFCALLSGALSCHASAAKVDSLQRSLEKVQSDTGRVNLLNKIASASLQEVDLESAAKHSHLSFELAERIGYTRGAALALELQAQVADAKSDFDLAITRFSEALKLYSELEDKKMEAMCYQGIANAYYSKGLMEKAMINYMSSLKIREQNADSSGIANSMMGLSIVYNDMRRNDLALSYGLKALGIKERLGETRTVSWLLNNVGTSYINLRDTTNALLYYERSLRIKEAIGDEYGIATTYKNIASIYLARGQNKDALDYYRRSYSIRYRLNPEDHHNHSRLLGDIGETFLKMEMPDSAYFYISQAIKEGETAGSYEVLARPYMNMALTLSKKGRYQDALDYMYKHVNAKDSVLNTQSNQLMTEMEAKYDSEKKEQQLMLQQTQIEQQRQKQNSLMLFIGLIIAFAAIVFTIVYAGYRNKKKANRLLSDKNNEIERQKLLVEEKNKDITDSIHYARRIQHALLPSDSYRKSLLPESFILFKPKDIVSGDFYWMERWGNKTIVAVVDCTGHGVPGAFMTFMSYSLLNEAVLEHGIDQPAAILNEMRRTLKKMLRQKNDQDALRDGMDIALCAIDTEKGTVEYAGAFNPLWIIRQGELIEIKADKQPIGEFIDGEQALFTNHVLNLEKGDMLYMFTDGYADQFGGDKGKKFKYKPLQNLLSEISTRAMEEQKNILDKTIEDWKGALQQVDDICILGFRV
jgi:serine phosphatase RsbU (regulator of sigma subunit)